MLEVHRKVERIPHQGVNWLQLKAQLNEKRSSSYVDNIVSKPARGKLFIYSINVTFHHIVNDLPIQSDSARNRLVSLRLVNLTESTVA